MSDDTRYAYAVARIRGMETRLLTRQMVERLLGETPEGALSALSDTSYQEPLTDVSRPEDIESGLVAALTETLSTVAALAPEPELTGVFRERWDFRNLRALLKASVLGIGASGVGAVDGPGLLELAALEKAVQDKDYVQLPEHLTDAARRAEEAYRDSSELSSIDRVIDDAMWRRSLSVAEELRNEFVVGYLRAEIDLRNVRTFVRIKQARGELDRLDRALIDGGTLEPSFFKRLLQEPLGELARALEYGRYATLAVVLRDWGPDHMPALERACDNMLLRLTDAGSTTAYGVEPLVRYMLVRELETKLVRTVVTGKLDGIDRSELESRLRDLHT